MCFASYKHSVLVFLFFLSNLIVAADDYEDPCFSQTHGCSFDQEKKTDSILDLIARLTLEQKIAQLMVVRIDLGGGQEELEAKSQLINRFHLGGVIFLHKGTLKQLYDSMDVCNAAAQRPLLYVQDVEVGLAQRIIDVPRYPDARVLGAGENPALVYEMARNIGAECAALGIHIACMPVLDVNTNPQNPIIGKRSFGDDPDKVAELGVICSQGLREGGVLACGKHFPGHGDTSVDSHKGLPVLNHDRERLNAVELVPFCAAIKEGIEAIMIGHLEVPCVEQCPGLPASLSYSVVTSLLRYELGFQGLVITDALDMKGVTNYFTDAEIALKAFQAGADILLGLEDIPAAINALKEAVEQGLIAEEEINKRLMKIFNVKCAPKNIRQTYEEIRMLVEKNYQGFVSK